MGKFIWHQWANFVAIFAAVYTTWAGFWGVFYRKFFWDWVDGTLGPAGIIPSKSAGPFVAVIVAIPLVQIFCMIFGLMTLAIEWAPLEMIKATSLHRSIPFRVFLLFVMSFLSVLHYQGTNGAVYGATALFGYAMAMQKGEQIEDPSDKGRRGSRA